MAELRSLWFDESIRVDRMSEEFEFDKLGFLRTFALEDPRSREISRLAVEEVGKIAIDAAGWAWSELKKSFSRPPAAEAPPPSAEAAPAPQDASVALPGTEPDDRSSPAQDHVVGVQGVAPEPPEMVGGRDPAGNEIFVPMRKS